ncbi:WD40 repeat-like protein [Hypoxylon sp. FL0890]|nr:WD40 repeat-like protein [Hypoxylon sp. FL0890]
MSCEPAVLRHLRRQFVLNPITALAFYTSSTDGQQYVLVGEDTDIKVYHVQTSRFCGQLPVLRAQSIHGIAVPPVEATHQSNLILVWGGHSIKILSTDLIEELISSHDSAKGLTRGPAEVRAPDWIFDGRVSPFGDGRIVLLTAHNEVIQAHVDPDRSCLVFDSIQSPSRPILYSGNFFWVSKDCVLVAAGTVFGEILVWKCYLGVAEGKRNCEVLFVFTGHEGSIFGVHISPEIHISTGETLRLLASCSDDRTIRVWDITERSDESGHRNQNGYDSRISDARETGFGNNAEATAHDSSSTRCLATVMGHASRIWQVEFPQDQPLSKTSNIIELYSFGEDATAQKWNLSLDSRSSKLNIPSTPSEEVTANLTHQSTFSNHSGKHIWSHAMASRSGGLLIATGGADGKVAVIRSGLERSSPKVADESIREALDKKKAVAWSLADVLQSSQSNDVTTNFQDGSNGPPGSLASPQLSIKPKSAKEAFNRYTFVSDRRLLAATNSGRIFVGAFEGGLIWTELILPNEIGQIVFSHALLGPSKANPMALIGTNNGNIYYYSESGDQGLQLLTKIDGKLGDIFCLSGPSMTSRSSYLQFLVTILRSTNAVIIQVDPNTLITEHIGVTLEQGFMVTAAALTHGYLVLGSRKGVIAALRIGEDGNYSTAFTTEVHKDEAITSIMPLHSRDNQLRNYILSTCRDGKYRIHEITTAPSQPNAVLIHEALPPFVSSVEGVWFSDNGDGSKDLMLCGFRSKNFVVWNETQHYEVATVDCGGSSRSYAWAPLKAQPDGFRFVFTKAGQMYVFSQMVACHKTLKVGGHGREIKAVSASSRYLATAAEDTVIRIWEYDGDHHDHSKLRCVAALEKHATGIQALKWYNNEYLFTSGGNEEFFVWKLNQLESNDFNGLAVVCEAVFPDRSEVGDARITDFDVTCAASDDKGAYEFRISMVLSNSTIQTYAYTKQAGFRLLRRSTYTGACLTQIRHLGRDHVLTAATDGHLALYANTEQGPEEGVDSENSADATAPIPVVTRLHQNTIKSLDVRQVAADVEGSFSEYLVVTGGDDNALGFTHISLPSTAQGVAKTSIVKSKHIIRSAHAAAITGIAIAHLGGDGIVVVSGSNDQRVKVWKLVDWQGQKQQLRAQLLDERYSSVADAGGLEVFEDTDGDRDREGKGKSKKVIVVGVGAEIWELEV